jgi:hypothetical protein
MTMTKIFLQIARLGGVVVAALYGAFLFWLKQHDGAFGQHQASCPLRQAGDR